MLALASACRYYFVITLGERVVADLRRDVFSHVTTLSPGLLRRSAVRRDRVAALRRHHPDKIGGRRHRFASRCATLILGLGAVGMMVVTSPKLSALVIAAIPLIVLPLCRLRPLGAPQGAGRRRTRWPRADRLCQRADLLGAHAAVLHQREAWSPAVSRARSKPPSTPRAPRCWRAPRSPSSPSSPSSPRWSMVLLVRLARRADGSHVARHTGPVPASIRCSPPARSARCRKSGANSRRPPARPSALTEILAERPAIAPPANPKPLPASGKGAICRIRQRHLRLSGAPRPAGAARRHLSR